ncbi:Transposase protein [Cinara cedri]|uniref:Transposase protein n=1 Tax=Cinara cedri TaxID=506608 RepID=A0A5E4MGA0_9HEMI|nr:Transposase protein [Cinara cedri]
MLAIKVSTMNDNLKECILVLDEMFLVECVSYDVSLKSFIGNVTLPNHNGVANHALVFMLTGILSRQKQSVAYYFTSDVVKGNTFKPIIIQIVIKAEELGLKVNSVTFYMGACNRAMWTSFVIHCLPAHLQNNILHPCDPECKKLYFLLDVPHLLKNIKQALFNNKFIKLPKEKVEKIQLNM